MKGKRYTTEEKIRILREADGGRTILEVCRAHNISEVSFHRWKRQFGMMEINEARRLKDLERENAELKKMLAESLLKNRVLEAVWEKKMVSPGHRCRVGSIFESNSRFSPQGFQAEYQQFIESTEEMASSSPSNSI